MNQLYYTAYPHNGMWGWRIYSYDSIIRGYTIIVYSSMFTWYKTKYEALDTCRKWMSDYGINALHI